jgi:hypothetical protein
MSEGLSGNVLRPLLLPEAEEHEVLGGVCIQPAGKQGLCDSVTEINLSLLYVSSREINLENELVKVFPGIVRI